MVRSHRSGTCRYGQLQCRHTAASCRQLPPAAASCRQLPRRAPTCPSMPGVSMRNSTATTATIAATTTTTITKIAKRAWQKAGTGSYGAATCRRHGATQCCGAAPCRDMPSHTVTCRCCAVTEPPWCATKGGGGEPAEGQIRIYLFIFLYFYLCVYLLSLYLLHLSFIFLS